MRLSHKRTIVNAFVVVALLFLTGSILFQLNYIRIQFILFRCVSLSHNDDDDDDDHTFWIITQTHVVYHTKISIILIKWNRWNFRKLYSTNKGAVNPIKIWKLVVHFVKWFSSYEICARFKTSNQIKNVTIKIIDKHL